MWSVLWSDGSTVGGRSQAKPKVRRVKLWRLWRVIEALHLLAPNTTTTTTADLIRRSSKNHLLPVTKARPSSNGGSIKINKNNSTTALADTYHTAIDHTTYKTHYHRTSLNRRIPPPHRAFCFRCSRPTLIPHPSIASPKCRRPFSPRR